MKYNSKTQIMKDSVISMREAGNTYKQIATAYAMSLMSVRKILKENAPHLVGREDKRTPVV